MMITTASIALALFLTKGFPTTPWNVTLAQIGRQDCLRAACQGGNPPIPRSADPREYIVIQEGQSPEQAIMVYEAQTAHRDQISHLEWKGRRFLLAGQLGDARRSFEQAMGMGGSSDGARSLADVMTRQGDLNQVLGMLAPWMDREDTTEDLLLYASLSAAHRQLVVPGQYEFCLAAVKRGSGTDTTPTTMLPDSRQAWAVEYLSALAIAWMKERTAESDGALFYYKKAATLWNMDALASHGLSEIYLRKNQMPEAKQALTQVARFGKGHIREEALHRLRSLP